MLGALSLFFSTFSFLLFGFLFVSIPLVLGEPSLPKREQLSSVFCNLRSSSFYPQTLVSRNLHQQANRFFLPPFLSFPFFSLGLRFVLFFFSLRLESDFRCFHNRFFFHGPLKMKECARSRVLSASPLFSP